MTRAASMALTLLLIAPGAGAVTLYTGFDAHDGADWFISDGWSNGSPFDVGWRSDHVEIAGGSMTLTLDDQPCASDPSLCSGQHYASGEYRSNDLYGYGRVYGSFMAASGDGLVTSLFTYTGPSDGNPHDEIDIEILGQDTTRMQVNYYVDGVGGHEAVIDLGFDAAAEFHEYAFEWRSDGIDWLVDDVIVYSVSAAPLPGTAGRVMMNLWAVDDTAEAWAGQYDGSPASAVYDYVGYTSLDELARVPAPFTPYLLGTGLLVLPRIRHRA